MSIEKNTQEIISKLSAGEISDGISANMEYRSSAIKSYILKNCLKKCGNFTQLKLQKAEIDCSNECLYSMIENFKAASLD